MAYFGTCALSVQESSDSVKIPILKATELGERWPVLLWFYVKTLGLYHSGNDITIVHTLNYFYAHLDNLQE